MSFMLSALTAGGIGVVLIVIILLGPITIGYAIYWFCKQGVFDDWLDTAYEINAGTYNVPDWVLNLKWIFDIERWGDRPEWYHMMRRNPKKAYARIVTSIRNGQSDDNRDVMLIDFLDRLHYFKGLTKYHFSCRCVYDRNIELQAQAEILFYLDDAFIEKKKIIAELFYRDVFPEYAALIKEISGEILDSKECLSQECRREIYVKDANKREIESYPVCVLEYDPNFTITTKRVHFKHIIRKRFNWKSFLLLLFLIGLFIFSLYACGMMLDTLSKL